MAECTHNGVWQENMFGRICQDCGFNTFENENGMYDGNKPIGLVDRLKQEIERTEGPKVIVIGGSPKIDGWQLKEQLHKNWSEPSFVYPDMMLSEDLKKQWEKTAPILIKAPVFSIEEQAKMAMEVYTTKEDDVKYGTKQKKFRKGNNAKRRKRK